MTGKKCGFFYRGRVMRAFGVKYNLDYFVFCEKYFIDRVDRLFHCRTGKSPYIHRSINSSAMGFFSVKKTEGDIPISCLKSRLKWAWS